MPTTSFMGGEVRRREDPRLITGSATYVDDIALPRMAYMAVLRSPFPHASIRGIDSSEAEAIPGVLAVITGEDVKDFIPPREGEQDGESGPPPRAPLAMGKATYVGDPVVAVIATSKAVAEDAVEHIFVDFEELPAVADPEAALQADAPQIWPYAAGNVDTTREFKAGDPDGAFEQAEATVSVRLVSQRLSPNPMEPRGIVAEFDGAGGTWTLWSSTQCAQFVRDAVCAAFGVNENAVRVICPEVGGGFGCKIGAYPEDVLAAYAARLVRRPIKWIETRTEHLQSTVHGRGQIAYLDLAARKDGTVTGLRLRLITDTGAYSAAWLSETTAGMITGCYDIPNVQSTAVTVLTNKTPLGAYRGAGRPEAAYYIERGIDSLADELGMDPAEIRRKNFVPPARFPYKLPDWPRFDTGEYEKALNAALERSGYADLRAQQEQGRAEGRILGVGLASYVEVCGFGWDTATVRVNGDGTVTIYTGISPHGQGQETTFAQMAADVLGVQPEDVTVLYGDTDLGPGSGTMGSRGTAVGGTAVYRAANEVREKMREIAAHMMEAAPQDMVLEDGAWHVAGVPDRSVTVEAVAKRANSGGRLPEGMDPGLMAINNFNPGDATAPFGTHVCTVEIDPDTGRVTIDRFLTVDDCGTIISPTLVRGQVHGGAAQGISQALFEEVIYSEKGQLLTGSLVDYAIPTAADLPSYTTGHTTTPGGRNELGIKGIGEAATIGATPAVVNAVIDALSPFGVRHLDMPLTSQRVWEAMHLEEVASQA